MTDIQIHPIALIVVGWSLIRANKQKVNATLILVEIFTVVLCLSAYPLMKWLLVKIFGENIEVVSFGNYFRLIIMLMIGRGMHWIRRWGE